MRTGEFEIWFDGDGANRPSGDVVSTQPPIRVAVRPPDDSLVVSIEFRRGGGVWQRRMLDPAGDVGGTRYFEGAFPELRPGEEVAYYVTIRSGGTRLVPERRVGELERFRVVDAGTRAAIPAVSPSPRSTLRLGPPVPMAAGAGRGALAPVGPVEPARPPGPTDGPVNPPNPASPVPAAAGAGMPIEVTTGSAPDAPALHAALRKLRVPAGPEAIRTFQERAGLAATGHVDDATATAMNQELAHRFFADSKTRLAKVQRLLVRTGAQIDPAELKARTLGPTTEAALGGRPLSAEVVGELEASALRARLASKNQVGQIQRSLRRAAAIAKLGVTIDPAELASKTLGPTSVAAITAFQARYQLPVTGELDPLTMRRIETVATSRNSNDVAALAATDETALTPVMRNLRLNATNKHVASVQQALAYLGQTIDVKEFKASKFGASTRQAVIAFQRAEGLTPNGHVDGQTRKLLNTKILAANPSEAASYGYRIRGSVRDATTAGRVGVRVQVWEKVLRGGGTLLAERPTRAGGFFDIPYLPPKDASSGRIKTPYHLAVKVLDGGGAPVSTKVVFNPTSIAWVNFIDGDQPYRGTSELDQRMRQVAPSLAGVALTDLAETAEQQDVTHVSVNSWLAKDDVMRLALAARVTAELADPALPLGVAYAFIRQNLPASLPGDLLASTAQWTLIDQLVEQTTAGIVFLDPDLAAAAFDNATAGNLIPASLSAQRAAVLAALAAKRETFTLTKPILVGNGTIQALLDASAVGAAHYPAVAAAFLTHRSFGADFWADARGRPDDFGGPAALDDLEETVRIGEITKNFAPTATQLKALIGNPARPDLTNARDFAKLDHDGWVALLTTNGNRVPPGTDGAGADAQKATYAATLKSQAERLYPTVAFVAEAARGTNHQLTHLDAVATLADDSPDLDLRYTNIDALVTRSNATVAPEALAEAKALQRISRISADAEQGRLLLDQGIHSAHQVIGLGRDQLVTRLGAAGVSEQAALTVWGTAQFRYAQAIARLVDYRSELNQANPKAIVSYTYTADELNMLSGGVPNLETLFGPADVCACSECESVLGAPAYLADLLRFLAAMPSETTGVSVKDVLFQRRPDLGDLLLGCANTNTAMPYIDIINELLEALVAPTDPPVTFQTTRPAAELRAQPENVRTAAYDTLRTADFPIRSSFDLWQVEARTFLDHLGVPREYLMELLQSGSPVPTAVSIAGEHFGLSSHETTLVVTAAADDARQTTLWGFDGATVPSSLTVTEFLARSGLTYNELLELALVAWVSPSGDPQRLVVQRPVDTAALSAQHVANLTAANADRAHRFLRLWRHTPWKMGELDRLIRSPQVGDGMLDAAALTRLRRAHELQITLGIGTEALLTTLGDIATTPQRVPTDPSATVPSTYDTLFQNRLVTNPVNAAFALPLAGGGHLHLADHRPALAAAIAVTDAELQLLLARTDGDLTVANLARLVGLATLARGLHLRVADLLTLVDLAGIPDPVASLDSIAATATAAADVSAGRLSIGELHYVLTLDPDSPYGLRNDVIVQGLEAIRQSQRSNPSATPDGQAIASISSTFGLTDEQSATLANTLKVGGATLLALLTAAQLTAQASDGTFANVLDETTFSDQFTAYRLLHKVAMVVSRHRLTDAAELAWLLAHAGDVGALALGDLPVTAAPGASLFAHWVALRQLTDFRDAHMAPDGASLLAVLDGARAHGATAQDIHAALSALTSWTTVDLGAVHTGLGLQPTDYLAPATLRRLGDVFAMLHRLGVDASQAIDWADRDHDASQFATAQQCRQAAKARYDDGAWATIVTPLSDSLREAKRNALLAHLVEQSQRTEPATITVHAKQWPNPKRWADADGLLAWLLIDVEMGACQLTSRIKQAISAVQLFVQGCFLNLEQAFVQVSRESLTDTHSSDNWRQWKWMKSYRVWEANRKVFLYPENWLEPDLRDDRSPFYDDLVSELMQSDLTDDLAETAFVHYLEKVHEVSRLDITGIYYEVDDDDPTGNLGPNINRLHVVGRTRTHPAVYFYRCHDLTTGEWTPWKQIDVDINGDQVVPVVYNRQLHLFWLVINEKPQKVRKQPAATTSDKPTTTPDPANQLELQLAWSLQTHDGGWTAKRMSRQKIVHPWQRPHSAYNLKPRYKPRENLLWIDLYLSTTAEFNNTTFYDHYAAAPTYVTATRFNEAIRPWHSSSFVFDGGVVDIKMKGLAGQYRLKNALGVMSDTPSATDSYTYANNAFGADGAAIKRLSGPYEIAPRLALPTGMHFENAKLHSNRSNGSSLQVLEGAQSTALLTGAQAPFELVVSQHAIQFDEAVSFPAPMIYQDTQRSFFIKPEWQQVIAGYNKALKLLRYTFSPMHHPYTALFLRELKRGGLEGLLNRKVQLNPQTFYPGNSFSFAQYGPTASSAAAGSAARDIVDFDRQGAYSIYNWETFFHAPLAIATKLSQNQRFEEAMRWFHFIFDPTNTDALPSPQRFWVTKPFYEQNADYYRKQRIEQLLDHIVDNTDQLNAWKNNPFNPHLIARFRPVAYQKNVVMRYIDNLIAWGDSLFRRDTIESINEATTLYLLARELLGPRPVQVPNIARADKSYNDLTADAALDPFGNAKVEVLAENLAASPVQVVATRDGAEPLPVLEISYFGIPVNDQLLGYWDTLAGRLSKVRHCMNLAGVVRQQPPFEPPIDPALLVKAAAAGIDIDSVLAGGGPGASQYRCMPLLQKALDFTADVRTFGDKILAALQNLDNEQLSLLRSTQEVAMLDAVTALKKDAVALAAADTAALEQSQAIAQGKLDYYASREFMNGFEIAALSLNGVSALAQTAIALGYSLAGGLALIPRFTIGASGFGGSPVAKADIPDGIKFSKAAECAVSTLGAIASAADKWAGMASTTGSYQRRADDWKFNADQATIELAQIAKQLDGSAIRGAVAQTELENHQLSIEQSTAVNEYLQSKYTNDQLYDWMIKQLSTVYFQAYQLAFDMARRAEAAMSYELGASAMPKGGFVQFGYWDGLKKGLLAGERLANDLRRLEAAWYEQNTRRLELTKHISLAQIDPLALVRLKTAGACDITLPEWLYDSDHPGHYQRRIKTVSLTVPCIVGPYTSVNATLSLTNHGTRVTEDVSTGYGDPLNPDGERFAKVDVPVQAIVTSTAQNDSGLFELRFDDERLLPFEGAGAVSTWHLALPPEDNTFDLATISDVVLSVRYTALAGSTALATTARTNRAAVVPVNGVRLIVLDQELPREWQRFLSPGTDTDQVLTFTLDRRYLPFVFRSATNLRLTRLDLIVESEVTGPFEVQLMVPGGAGASTETLAPDLAMRGAHHLVKTAFNPPTSPLGTWTMKIRRSGAPDFRSLSPDDLREAYLVVGFTSS
ncbi:MULTISPECIES: Tc toxin subunit A-related protein [Parafrankia]|uniref:Tc toxin subunit A-related protein n=1 Tax=Parafrankia TaxID=2994362 RepID=UPI000B83B19B|nr:MULTISPECIES: neuraminidase-like domain-containing protein [Parafrankia]MBE3200237.1 peptidoglycan-binding protein [Parafrankia sp. CH37]